MQLRLLTSNLTELSIDQLPTRELSASQHTISRKSFGQLEHAHL